MTTPVLRSGIRRRQLCSWLVVLAVAAACDSSGTGPPERVVATVVVTPGSAPLTPGATQQFTARALDANGDTITTTFSWLSTAANVAAVNGSGLATGAAAGMARIRATAPNGVFGEATVTVTVPPVVATVQLSPNTADVTPTTTAQFTATARDANGNVVATTFTWSSAADHVASVNATGLVSGAQAGTTQIRATAAGGSVFGEASVTVIAPPAPLINIATSQQISAPGREPTVSAQVPATHKVIGCGARTFYNPADPGILLTAVYPSDARTCTASAKDHVQQTTGTVQVWAVAIVDPNDEWDVTIVSQSQPGITATATLPAGYALTGGGARLAWQGAGVLLTSTRPTANTWVVSAKEHLQSDATANTTSYVIGIKPRNGAAPPATVISSVQANGLEARATVTSGFTIVGGGATIAYNGPGRLLTGTYPENATWIALGKEHLTPDVGTITAYVIGVRVP